MFNIDETKRLDGQTHEDMGVMRQNEAVARGEVPSATDILVEQTARHARHEAVMREMARRGHALTGTSVLEHLQHNPVRPPVLVPPRRYNILDRLGHICTWLLNDTPIPAQPRLPTAAPGPARTSKGPLKA